MQTYNDWGVSYSSILFFERVLSGHDKVTTFKRTRDILFTIDHIRGETITVILVDEYCLGLAAIYKARDEFSEADYIVTCGNWNGYTQEAKQYGQDNNIGIFNSREFFGALNCKDIKSYYRKDGDGNPRYAYESA